MIKLRCSSCRQNDSYTVVSSVFGAISYAVCPECLRVGKEPYGNMVNYISCAGRWPEDINKVYQTEVRRQLQLHEVSEEVFKFEVEKAIAEEQVFIKECCNTNKNEEVMPNEVENLFS